MAQAAIKELALEALTPSPTNPRRTMKEDALEELAASVREHGVLQPVLARPVGKGKYELVFGHRRLEAARRAGLKTIPAMVRELGDKEVLEAQVLENLAREDVPPVEEADGLRRLHEEFGLEVEELATRLGRSHRYVFQRMRLCALPQAAREALDEGRLLLGVALLISRIPAAALREAATEHLVVDAGEDPTSIADARDVIERSFARRLDKAPFDVADAKLYAKAGSCSKCGKRTGNQRALFEDLTRDDVCTDPPCFAAKVDAEWARRAAAARKAGRVVLEGEDAKEVFPTGTGTYPSFHFVDLDEPWYEGAGDKGNLRAQLGAEVDKVEILVRDPSGQIRTLARRDDVREVLGQAREARLTPKDRAEIEEDRRRAEREAAERQAKRELEAQVQAEAKRRILETMEQRTESGRLWWAMALAVAGEWQGPEAILAGFQRRGQLADLKPDDDETPDRVRAALKASPAATVRGLVCEVLLDRVETAADFEAIASIYDVNLAQLERELAPPPETPKTKRAARANTRASASAMED